MISLSYLPPNPLPPLQTVADYVGNGQHFGKCAACGSQFMSLHDRLAIIDGEKHCPRCAGYGRP